MKTVFISFITLTVIVAGSGAYYFYFVNRIKTKSRILEVQINRFTEKFKAERLDKYYESIDTEKLVKEYKLILDAYNEFIGQQEKLAELGSKENLISDVIAARGIDIDALINMHPKNLHISKNVLKDNIKIVSVKTTTILSYILFEILMLIGVALFSFDMYTQIYSQGTGWEWFASIDNLLEGLFLLLFIYCIFSLIQQFRMNVYSLKMEKEDFTYRSLLIKTIPYSKVSRILLVNYAARGGQEIQLLKIILSNKRIIRLRLDHLDINKSVDVIRPRKPYYLKGLSNENMILDFLMAKTGKSIEKITGERNFF